MEAEVSIILPTYNEKGNIGFVIDEIKRCVQNIQEIIVVDDNSPDKTWAVVEAIAEKDYRVKLIKRINERGLTSAIWAGIIHAKGDYIVWMDCDMGMPPDLITKLTNELRDYDIAVGSRYVSGGTDSRSFFRRFTSYLLNRFAGIILKVTIRDLTTGFVAVRRAVFDKIKLKGNYGEYCIRFLYEANEAGFGIKEIPYTFKDRTKGRSKSESRFFKFGIGYISTIIRLRRLSI